MSERIGFYICHCGINIAYRVRVRGGGRVRRPPCRTWSSPATTCSCAPTRDRS